MIEQVEPCDDYDDCRICRGAGLSPELFAQIKAAAAGPYVIASMEEFSAWIDSLEAQSSHSD